MCEGDADADFQLQESLRENAEELNSFLSEMAEWERSSRLQQTHLSDAIDLPDDQDKACELIDQPKTIPPSLDGKDSEEDKKERLKQEAHLEKEKGNKLVQEKKWDEAIECYTRAIDLYQNDAIYFANRALCYLKKEKLHEAEADCTTALELDPTYIKALQRRSCAREGLGSLRRAACDLSDILRIQPDNVVVQRQLSSLIQRMGTKGPNSKSSPATTPSGETSPPQFVFEDKNVENVKEERSKPNITEKSSHKESKHNKKHKKKNTLSEIFVEAIEKPPHLRSREPLIRIPIGEIPKGSSITAVSLKSSANDFTKTVAKYMNKKNPFKHRDDLRRINAHKAQKAKKSSPKPDGNIQPKKGDSIDLKVEDTKKQEYENKAKPEPITEVQVVPNQEASCETTDVFGVPKSAVQFLSDWRLLKGKDKQRSAYLKAIHPSNVPSIFKESLESDVLSDILKIICASEDFSEGAFPYLKSLSEVRRFSTLAMFLSDGDKQALTDILNRCKENGECSDEDMQQIKNKYEI
ncbi:RNA polymerase II-associated protein spaghetti isoform X2 [Arctopsyche grandis]|uniref:RNA polymerase II-associated protein spaghetti isoform X2 n=1 Tax=Arctopsyche grandis TaxID=121162 RepID=UPI00406D88D1